MKKSKRLVIDFILSYDFYLSKKDSEDLEKVPAWLKEYYLLQLKKNNNENYKQLIKLIKNHISEHVVSDKSVFVYLNDFLVNHIKEKIQTIGVQISVKDEPNVESLVLK